MARRSPVALLAGLALLALAGALWWWVQGPSSVSTEQAAGGAAQTPQRSTQASQPVVELAAARHAQVQDTAQAVGSLGSRQSVMLRPEASGRVARLNFADGQRVQKGQLLVQLDDRLARAEVQQSRAELGIAQSNHQRNVELVEQGFISTRAVDESAAAVAVARARLELAQAGAARLQVLAPFDGMVGIGRVSLGDMLQAGADIATLEDMDAMLLDYRLPERHQPRLRPGQLGTVRLDALPGHVFEAVVQAIDPVIDAEGRSVGVRACIDNRAGLLRPGMFARVHTTLGERSDAVLVPEQAVVPLGGAFYVYVLEGDVPPSNGDAVQVQRREVTLGARLAGQVELVSGLRAGEQLVVAGQQRLSTATARVRVAPTRGEPEEAAAAAVSGGADEGLIWHRAERSGNPCAVPGRP